MTYSNFKKNLTHTQKRKLFLQKLQNSKWDRTKLNWTLKETHKLKLSQIKKQIVKTFKNSINDNTSNWICHNTQKLKLRPNSNFKMWQNKKKSKGHCGSAYPRYRVKTLSALDTFCGDLLGYFLWTLFVGGFFNTYCGLFLWALFVDSFCERILWTFLGTLFVDTFSGHFVIKLFVDNFCGHFLWALFVDTFGG